MTKLQIIAGPDRLAFVNSLFNEIDSVPIPGWVPPSHACGGVRPPLYRGEAFLTKDEEGRERQLLLVITRLQRKDCDGMSLEFTAVLWAVCDEFRDLIFGNPLGSWVEFKGEFDFSTQRGWLERI